MEFKTLQYFLAVVREENISRAAEVLHITQPALSRYMSQLEEELGTQLFIRGRHLTLTDAGIMLRRRAEEVISLIEKIENEFEEQSEMDGLISIGAGGLNASRMLPPIIENFRQKYPKVQFHFYTNSAEHIKERIEQGLLDFGLLMEPIDVSKYDYIRMKEKEKWGLLMRVDSPLAVKPYITKEDLYGIPLMTTDRVSVQKEFENWFGDEIGKLDIFMTFNIITNAMMFVSSGLNYALTIEGAVNMFDKEQLTFRPLYPELSASSVLVWKKFHPNFGAAGKFLEHLKSMRKNYTNI
ncbi:LysR substrate-binding domain-containing protein [Eubacterium callanderi]|uniref:LysR family transcriptional regulator n=1 Tax=Eubacterium callanderi TaxID=53442 RepID=A0A853JLZ0_9FIRM|nr:LysR family transcriptional regulator [Eubacterium callanderi]